ncbi:hypothetical protein KBC85_00345 [Candidatus Saccharibacteria bacterium]|nr:hypothetical protein [Candidatus Saccharibacteria bacterium]
MDIGTISSQQLVYVILIGLWSLVWKAFALWKAAGQKDKVWFVALIILNTLGILDILYIFVFSKRKQ